MGKLVVGLSVSLDGFIAGPNDGKSNPLGDGGAKLFEWWTAATEGLGPDDRFRPPARSRAAAEEAFGGGAIITGRRTFEIANGWGGHHPARVPFFLLTHKPPECWVGPGTEGTVVTEGIGRVLELAQAAAGEKTIGVCGANVAQQYLRARLLDEVQLTLVPVLLGGGVRLFDNLGGAQYTLEQFRVIESDDIVHLSYRVLY